MFSLPLSPNCLFQNTILLFLPGVLNFPFTHFSWGSEWRNRGYVLDPYSKEQKVVFLILLPLEGYSFSSNHLKMVAE